MSPHQIRLHITNPQTLLLTVLFIGIQAKRQEVIRIFIF